MDDKNELNDIILNKGNPAGSNKKIILAVATLGIVLIIVVMLMNSMSSDTTQNLPQAALPPTPQTEVVDEQLDEPLFEDVQVMQEDTPETTDLDKIAQKLKQESRIEQATAPKKSQPVIKKTEPKRVAATPKPKPAKKEKATTSVAYYVQVGSFSKYEPNKRFLNSIKKLGFNYKYHKVGSLNKVLVGPFPTRKEAQRAKKVLRAKVEPGAFLVKL